VNNLGVPKKSRNAAVARAPRVPKKFTSQKEWFKAMDRFGREPFPAREQPR
jgi:hypothetical protein